MFSTLYTVILKSEISPDIAFDEKHSVFTSENQNIVHDNVKKFLMLLHLLIFSIIFDYIEFAYLEQPFISK